MSFGHQPFKASIIPVIVFVKLGYQISVKYMYSLLINCIIILLLDCLSSSGAERPIVVVVVVGGGRVVTLLRTPFVKPSL